MPPNSISYLLIATLSNKKVSHYQEENITLWGKIPFYNYIYCQMKAIMIQYFGEYSLTKFYSYFLT